MVVLSLAMEVDGRPDVVLDLSATKATAKAAAGTPSPPPVVIKEGVDYRMKVRFRWVPSIYPRSLVDLSSISFSPGTNDICVRVRVANGRCCFI